MLVRGIVSAFLLGINTLPRCFLIFVLALVKLAIPVKPLRVKIDGALNEIADR